MVHEKALRCEGFFYGSMGPPSLLGPRSFPIFRPRLFTRLASPIYYADVRVDPFRLRRFSTLGIPPFIVDSAFRKGAKENAPDVAAREVGGEIYPARLRRRG